MNEGEEEPLFDPLSLLRAQLDQILAMAPELARSVRVRYDAFRGAGFTDAQALYLAAVHSIQNPGTPPA